MHKKTREILAALPTAETGFRYVVIGRNVWQGSVSAAGAAIAASDNGGRGKYVLHLVNDGFEVSDIDGTLHYNSKLPGVKINLATLDL